MKKVNRVLLCLLLTLAFCTVSISTMAASPFADVSAEDWFYGDVVSAYEKGLFTGIDATTFAPYDSMTRAMFVTVLGRSANIAPEAYTSSPFEDVAIDIWYGPYVIWAEENNIVNGIGNNRFAPDDTITREQIAKILAFYAGASGLPLADRGNIGAGFADEESIASWVGSSWQLMQKTGIISGDETRRFNPQQFATRAETAAIMVRLDNAKNSAGAYVHTGPSVLYSKQEFSIPNPDPAKWEYYLTTIPFEAEFGTEDGADITGQVLQTFMNGHEYLVGLEYEAHADEPAAGSAKRYRYVLAQSTILKKDQDGTYTHVASRAVTTNDRPVYFQESLPRHDLFESPEGVILALESNTTHERGFYLFSCGLDGSIDDRCYPDTDCFLFLARDNRFYGVLPGDRGHQWHEITTERNALTANPIQLNAFKPILPENAVAVNIIPLDDQAQYGPYVTYEDTEGKLIAVEGPLFAIDGLALDADDFTFRDDAYPISGIFQYDGTLKATPKQDIYVFDADSDVYNVEVRVEDMEDASLYIDQGVGYKRIVTSELEGKTIEIAVIRTIPVKMSYYTYNKEITLILSFQIAA